MNKIKLLGGLLIVAFIAMFNAGCGQNVLAKTLGPQDPVFDATPVPTAVPTPTTSTAKTMYLKIKPGTPGTTCTIATVQVWVIVSGVTTYLYNGPVTLDSSNNWTWSSTQSNAYTPTDPATFYFNIPSSPSNVGLVDEVHRVANSVDTVWYTGTPPANNPDGGSYGY